VIGVASIYRTASGSGSLITWECWLSQPPIDAENRMVTFNGGSGTTTYTYDGDGRRVRKVDNAGVTSVYAYNAHGQLAAEYSSQASTVPGGTSYVLADHLGSTRLMTHPDGTLRGRHDYLPFGEEIGTSIGGRASVPGYGVVDIRQKFTAKERDAESNLDYFLARYYSGAQGRFMSVDPENAGAVPHAPQSWNGYAYAINNPLLFIDPTGKRPCEKGSTRDCQDSRHKNPNILINNGGFDPVMRGDEIGTRDEVVTGALKELANQGIDLYNNVMLSGLSDPELRREFEVSRFEASNLSETGGMLLASTLMMVSPTKGPSGKVSTLKFLERRWDKATFGSVWKSIKYHLRLHGKGLSEVQYTQQAVKAFEDTSAVRKAVTDLQGRAAVGVSSQFGDGLFTPQGKIIWFHPKR
jgi:RHS repeat-associated protein